MDKQVRVFIASGSARESGALSAVIKRAPDMTLAGIAADLASLMEGIEAKRPDALLLDMDTFGADPVIAVRLIMRQDPLPIVLVTANERDTDVVFETISAGALTVVKKPVLVNAQGDDKQTAGLLKAIKTYASITVIRHVMGGKSPLEKKQSAERKKIATEGRIVAIASSTGGPQALNTVLSGLPASFPAGIVVAQHISQGFTAGLIEWLENLCVIRVKVADDREKIKPGIAYFAPDGFHITIGRFEMIRLDDGPAVSGHRPSCNKLLKSAAEIYGDKAIGVILSGMGEDGAAGLKAIRDAGGKTFAQDEVSCAVFGMPKVALEKGAVDQTTRLDQIGWEIIREMR